MVLGRVLAGSDVSHVANGCRSFATGSVTSKTFFSPAWKTDGPPPAPSIIA